MAVHVSHNAAETLARLINTRAKLRYQRAQPSKALADGGLYFGGTRACHELRAWEMERVLDLLLEGNAVALLALGFVVE